MMDDKPIECPWCKEITYEPVRVETLSSGESLISYECKKCPCQGTFNWLSIHLLKWLCHERS